jgi:endonuclease/exonuclease/phosphatase (EEP) superfamily protein YafD
LHGVGGRRPSAILGHAIREAAKAGRRSMTQLFPDTSADAQRVLIERLRDLPPWRKLLMAGDLNATAMRLALMGLRARLPDATDQELRRHLADLVLGTELAAKAYGPHHAG